MLSYTPVSTLYPVYLVYTTDTNHSTFLHACSHSLPCLPCLLNKDQSSYCLTHLFPLFTLFTLFTQHGPIILLSYIPVSTLYPVYLAYTTGTNPSTFLLTASTLYPVYLVYATGTNQSTVVHTCFYSLPCLPCLHNRD